MGRKTEVSSKEDLTGCLTPCLRQRADRQFREPVHGLRGIQFPEVHPVAIFFVPQIAVAHFPTQCSAGTGLRLTGRF
jgi:hypothetical protein